MAISGQKNRTIRRKLGPNRKTDSDTEIKSSRTVTGDGESRSGKVEIEDGDGDGEIRSGKVEIGNGDAERRSGEVEIVDDENDFAEVGTGDEESGSVGVGIGDGKTTGRGLGSRENGEVGVSHGVGVPPPVQTIVKTSYHRYIPERSKWWWIKYVCCVLIIALLLLILWCLYTGCSCKNVSNNRIDGLGIPYYTDGNAKNIIEGRIKPPPIDENGIKGTIEGNEKPKPIDGNGTKSVGEEGENSIPVDKNDTQESSVDKNTALPNDNSQKAIEDVKNIFTKRSFTSDMNPSLKSIGKNRVDYMSPDGKIHKKIVNAFSVMPSEVSIQEYAYFANTNSENYPAFWNGSENDLRTNIHSKYKLSCLEEQCPIIGISPKNIEKYIEWLNEKVIDGHYELMTESQWHSLASYDKLDEEVVYSANSSGKAQEVNGKLPNHLGIYNSYGNVAEIVKSKDGYVVIGGSWKSSKNELEQKYRIKPTDKDNWFGFRLVKIKDKKDKK